MNKPPVFIVGLPRCGNTLWARIISNHSEFTAFGEMHFLTPWRRDFRYLLRQIGDLEDDENVRRLVGHLFAAQPVPGITRGNYFWKQIRNLAENDLPAALENRLLGSKDRSIGVVFRSIIEEATRCRGKERAVVRLPVFPKYTHDLMQWWPEAKVVHISRDPRGLASSKTNDPGGTGRLKERYPVLRPLLPLAGQTFAVIQYVMTSLAHDRVRNLPNYRLFFYEDLITDPENTIRQVCEHCAISFEESMLQPQAGQASSVTGERASGFDPTRAHGWKIVLSEREAKIIAWLTRRSMRRFGFDPEAYESNLE